MLPFKNGNFFQYCDSKYRTFLYCFPFSYWSANFAIAKVVALCLNFCMSFEDWFIASFLYCFPYSYRSSNSCDSNSCLSFPLLKALAKSNCNLIAIAFKSEMIKSDNKWYWKNEWLDGNIIISYFGDSNNIFADCNIFANSCL